MFCREEEGFLHFWIRSALFLCIAMAQHLVGNWDGTIDWLWEEQFVRMALHGTCRLL